MTTENFEDMNLKDELLRGIFSYGYEKPSSIQQKSIMPILSGKDIIVQSQSGTGKCHAKNTPIIMFDGSIKMVQDIQVGELLMGDDSTPREVLSLATGKDEMYDIIPTKGEKYTVNQEHILCLKMEISIKKIKNSYRVSWFENHKFNYKSFDNKINAEIFIKTINYQEIEISVKDYLKLSNNTKKFLKGYKTSIDFLEKPIDFDPYIIGFWLPSRTSSGSRRPLARSRLNKMKEHLIEHNYYNEEMFQKFKEYVREANSAELTWDEYIPMIYKCNSRENRLRLLAGLIDSDGSLDSNRCYDFSQKSEKLIDDVIYLARSLGFACYKSKQKKGCWYKGEYKEDYYRIRISGNGIEDIPVLCPRKKASPRKQIKDVLVTGISVNHIGKGDYYGFTLNGNNRYVLGDFTVTHNTACFAISILQTVDETKSYAQALVMAPTRELANQISTVITILGDYIDNLKICTCIGGIKTNFYELKNAQIIVGTPGRIFDVISNKNLNVSNLRMFVLDEADEMLSAGFAEQVQEIFTLINETSSNFQKIILSATLSPDIIEITENFMNNPMQILVKNDELTLEGIKQYYINVDKEEWKIETLYDLYNNISVAQTIIFVNSKKKIEWVYDMMKKQDYPITLIHSDLEQSERNEILKNFKNGSIRMLLSTDLFARGIDVQQVSLVINYDLPKTIENYIHRIGRSGRFGRKGVSINFITNDDINYQKNIETFYNTQIEELPANVNEIII